tara:strand:+ start:3660 stop:4595 length:936 start_codon:yes stop_codon:yes gene_type:complete
MVQKILAIQGNSFKKLNIITDTTYLLALEAQKRNYQIYWYETKDVSFLRSKLIANIHHIRFLENQKKYYKVLSKKKFELDKSKFILIRQNPPFNIDYITSTLFLDTIKNKVKIVNNPTSIRNISEKLFSINFKKLMPPTIFTNNLSEIKKFINTHKKIVLKPIHGYAGKDIIFINRSTKVKKIHKYIKKFNHIMVQKYLPGIKKGDKRVFIINGKVKGAISRIPSSNSILSNLSQGGKAVKTTLSSKEFKVSKQVAKVLIKNQIFFAGIDLVSGYLIGDINVTSPTGLPQFKKLAGINLGKYFWDELEKSK